jgi:hypothetical protein
VLEIRRDREQGDGRRDVIAIADGTATGETALAVIGRVFGIACVN